MTALLIFILTASLAGSSLAEDDSNLAERLFSQEDIPLAVMSARLSSAGKPANQADVKSVSSDELNPGKALLLSAIMPGAGEYYAGFKWRAAAFFTMEIAAWTSMIYFYKKGQDKDAEFKKYADAHFNEWKYRHIEFGLARNSLYGDSGSYPSADTLEWMEEDWDVKTKYLPQEGFTHNMPTQRERDNNANEDQQYYEMIGKYIHQFGFGWDDAFGDTDKYPHFEGESPNSLFYMDMRYESNQLLDRSSLALQLVMLNHVASALHASFSVRAMKRKVEASVGFRATEYDGHTVTVGGLGFRW